jgi:hypothetical protein
VQLSCGAEAPETYCGTVGVNGAVERGGLPCVTAVRIMIIPASVVDLIKSCPLQIFAPSEPHQATAQPDSQQTATVNAWKECCADRAAGRYATRGSLVGGKVPRV